MLKNTVNHIKERISKTVKAVKSLKQSEIITYQPKTQTFLI